MAGNTIITKKRKKKGRPSLLDLQKRALKQELQQQRRHNPPLTPSNNHNLDQNPNSDPPPFALDYDDDDDERKEKKLKSLLGLDSQPGHHHQLNSSAYDDCYGSSYQIGGFRLGSAETDKKFWKATDTLHGSPGEPGPTTPLPDKKLLVFILDRLQKKDTYGVFSEPVDPEELPDYHEIIEHPMDFSTVRKKLDCGKYFHLEQFEKDIFLICSNAMEYNSSDSVYFRQARSIQELAKKDFENLRQDSDDGELEPEPEPKPERVVRRGRPPGKKKTLEKSPLDHVAAEFSQDGYNLRRTTTSLKRPADALVKVSLGSQNGESYSSWQSEWENEFPASVLKAVQKHVKKSSTVDENRRHTYNPPSASTDESSVMNLLGGEPKQVMPVGLSSEYGYARSLARFAADLGPTAWRIASEKIRRVLPMGVEFGPGWVADTDVLQGDQADLFNDDNTSGYSTEVGDPSSSHQLSTIPSTPNMNHTSFREDMAKIIDGSSSQGGLPSLNEGRSGIKPMLWSEGFGGLPSMGWSSSHHNNGAPSQTLGMVPSSYTTFGAIHQGRDTNMWKLENSISGKDLMGPGSWTGLQSETENGTGCGWRGLSDGLWPYPPHNQEELLPFQMDLNVGFLSPSSPTSTGVPFGSPQQPDLALQL